MTPKYAVPVPASESDPRPSDPEPFSIPPYQDALNASRKRQAIVLRSMLPQPFMRAGLPIRGEVYFDDSEAEYLLVFCRPCGETRGHVAPGVMFDVRGLRCKGCGQSLTKPAG